MICMNSIMETTTIHKKNILSELVQYKSNVSNTVCTHTVLKQNGNGKWKISFLHLSFFSLPHTSVYQDLEALLEIIHYRSNCEVPE